MKKIVLAITVVFILTTMVSKSTFAQRRVPSERITERRQMSKENRERILKLTLPDYEDYKNYKEFWRKRPKSYQNQHWFKKGMFRLFPARGCEKKYVITVKDDCLEFIPFLTSYNFRSSEFPYKLIENDYDIKFKNGKLVSDGFLNLGILVSLGDKNIREVSLSSSGMKFLTDFKPAEDKENARKQFIRFSKGVNKDGFFYSNQIQPIEGKTYALRVIPYRIRVKNRKFDEKALKKISNAEESKTFFQFRRVKRSQRLLLRLDSIFIFKIIRKNKEDKGLTIVWKRLLKKESPRLIFSENERLTDIK